MKTRMKGRRLKRGASLAMVLVSMTILSIMGTLFTAIAMRSYQYSYSKLCKQQAYYTATSSIEAFYSIMTSQPTVLNSLLIQLDNAYQDRIDENPLTVVDPTTVNVVVGATGGGDGSGNLISGGFFDTFLGECTLTARYSNTDMTELTIEARASYNGYTETARARIVNTSRAASELKKIFDNTFCLQSPVTTIVTDGIQGDVYVSQPVVMSFYDKNGNAMPSDYVNAYNTVLDSLNHFNSYGGSSALPGQYLRDSSGRIITGNSNAAKYNYVLRECVYGNVQSSTSSSSLKGHTKPLETDNTIVRGVSSEMYYNDWVELYLFSTDTGATTMDGNLYVNSKALIGLMDRNEMNRDSIRVWNDEKKRYDLAVGTSNYTSAGIFDEYIESKLLVDHLISSFEHGFSESVFFDHQTNDVLDPAVSKFRINGNMYLWEDTRIENMDSTQTANALAGVKNNIYAAKDLYIDGIYATDWDNSSLAFSSRLLTNRQVSVYGDIVVQGDAFISGADIYGDVYCYGDSLSLVDVNVYGNVYFEGSDFTADRLTVSSGTLTVSYNGQTATQVLNGGNLVVEGGDNNVNASTYNPSAAFGTEADVRDWGAVLIDTSVENTFWSGVNTHIVASKSEANLVNGTTGYCKFGNIYVNAYLFVDLMQLRDEYSLGAAKLYEYKANYLNSQDNNYAYAARNNRIDVTGMLYAERLQIMSNQSWVSNAAISNFGNVCVGNGGLYIDGNRSSAGDWNIRINGDFKSVSNGSCYNTNKFNTGSFGINANWNDIYGMLGVSAAYPDQALQMKLAQVIVNYAHNPYSYYETVFETEGRKVWDDKVITLRNWSAPLQYDENGTEAQRNELRTVDYAGGENGFIGTVLQNSVDKYLEYIVEHPEAGSVSGSASAGTYTLTIKQSVCFGTYADFTKFDRVIVDTTEGNIHVKFLGGAEFGNPDAKSFDEGSDVVLTGGNLTFWYLYEEGGYDFESPTLKVNPFTNLGLIEVSTGRGNDGLYIISNSDCLMYFGADVCLNGFVYAPNSHLFIEPGGSGTLNTLNGCMAIESLILLTDGDVKDSNIFQDFIEGVKDWFGDKNGEEIIDATVQQYENSTYNYVMPPLIVGTEMQYGNSGAEIDDFASAVWEFMGYY